MSLTSFLTYKDVKEKFLREFPMPNFDLRKEILAPPRTNHYSLVGTAFDYLMRFYLKRINPKAIPQPWIAEHVARQNEAVGEFIEYSKHFLEGMVKFMDVLGKVPELRKLREAYDQRELMVKEEINSYLEYLTSIYCWVESESIRKKIEGVVLRAGWRYSDFLRSGRIESKIIRSAIELAQIDPIYRAGFIDENIGRVDKEDTKDLRKLICIVNPKLFKATRLCILNPTFGEGSELVGGADADILIDNALIDIKTTKYFKLDRRYFHQLIGYYILSRIGGIDSAPGKHRIDTLGVYYSRYGELFRFPAEAVISERKLPSFIKWFKKRAISALREV